VKWSAYDRNNLSLSMTMHTCAIPFKGNFHTLYDSNQGGLRVHTPTRRDLLKYAAGATLASAIPIAGCRKTSCMPLVVDLIGPMAFQNRRNAEGENIVDVWLPDLTTSSNKSYKFPHVAGIITPVDSVPFDDPGDYCITGPTPFSGSPPTPYLFNNCKVFQGQPADSESIKSKKLIHVMLPMPHRIAALAPVLAKIAYPSSGLKPEYCTPYAVGLRFLYDNAGVLLYTIPNGTSKPIPFNPSPGETQLNMSIEHAALNRQDDDDAQAKDVFGRVSEFCSQPASVDFDCTDGGKPQQEKKRSNPMHHCRAPICFLASTR
jgi:hypothetical protein